MVSLLTFFISIEIILYDVIRKVKESASDGKETKKKNFIGKSKNKLYMLLKS
jgi:hypothetical protein